MKVLAKKQFVRPQMRFIPLPDLPEGTELASLSDEALLALLEEKRRQELSRCYKASQNFISREIAGQTVLVPVDGAQFNGMIAMTPTGSFLMEQMQGVRTHAQLADALEKRYGIPNETAIHDVATFVNKALRDGIIVVCGA